MGSSPHSVRRFLIVFKCMLYKVPKVILCLPSLPVCLHVCIFPSCDDLGGQEDALVPWDMEAANACPECLLVRRTGTTLFILRLSQRISCIFVHVLVLVFAMSCNTFDYEYDPKKDQHLKQRFSFEVKDS